MRVRHIVRERKTIESDSRWSTKDLQPRHAPIYAKTKPIRAGWRWRSARARGQDGREFILLAECNPPRDNWKAMLIVETVDGPSVVVRFEHHGSHPGLHIHVHCERSGVETGAGGMDSLDRMPGPGSLHRRANGWTEHVFWEAAKRFFRIEEEKGPLI